MKALFLIAALLFTACSYTDPAATGDTPHETLKRCIVVARGVTTNGMPMIVLRCIPEADAPKAGRTGA